MKPNQVTFKWSYGALLMLGISVVLPSQLTVAATTDLANIPLVNATTSTVLPNVLFILDDSGSMAWDYLPDDAKTVNFWKSPHCNGLAYNPATTYSPAVKYDGTYYSNASYTGAWNNGYVGGTTTDLTGATYYTYTGTELDLGFTYDAAGNALANNFYNECNTFGPWTTTISLSGGGGNPSTSVTSILVNGVELMSGASSSSTTRDTVGSNVAAKITMNGFSATYNSSTDKITITTSNPVAFSQTPVVTKAGGTGSTTFSAAAFPAASAYPGIGKFTAGAPTTAAQQQNYANWYSYYHTRILMAKTSIGLAFQDVRGWPLDTVVHPDDANYFHGRVGFTTISNAVDPPTASKYLKIDDFNSSVNTATGHLDNSQKQNFYTKLYAQTVGSSTPLRGALSKAGRLYAGKLSDDPVQYSCQKNFTILTTDGYWNKGSETSTYTALDMTGAVGMHGAAIGDVDGLAGVSTPSYDAAHSTGSLADIAYYYYHTDLRPGTCTLCIDNVPPSSSNLTSTEEDVATWQHMTTFTVGLGLSGRLRYDDNYKAQTSATGGDYYALKQGTKSWPDPQTSSTSSSVIERIDDLWHAAVNGRGTYLSAKSPEALQNGLKKALGSIAQKVGAGAAAGTSSLNPVPGDNTAFVATYSTVSWAGDLTGYPINLTIGDPKYGLPDLTTPLWSAATQLAARIPAPGNSESPVRNIKTGANAAGFKDFQWASLTATEKSFLDNTKLSQYASWDATQTPVGTGQNMLNFLRGWYQYEEGTGTPQLYRSRVSGTRFNLGDIAHAQPVYVKKPPYSFADPGYADFKTAQDTRTGTVYVSANDGMLHAFDGATGVEKWAYVPPMVLPNLWRLADEDYADRHVYFVDGPLAVADVKIGADWKTVLLASMGKGARGYFAMDVTDPANPKMLWSFTADPAFSTNPADSNYYDANIGYTYGAPLAAKLKDGTWVAVMTSGYNNVPEAAAYTGGPTFSAADGKGYVFVIDMATGKKIKTISTGIGSEASPSGLGKVNLFTEDFITDNTSELAYGGDLLGSLWRFNLTAGTVTKLFAGVATQPITVAPEIGKVSDHKLLYFGTGRYLGQSDLKDQSVQAIYGIKDDDSGSTITGTSTLFQQTQAVAGGAITGNPVDLSAGHNGWYVNLKAVGERVALDSQLYLGVLVVSSTIPVDPSNANLAACSAGGSGVVYELNFSTGGSLVTVPVNSPPVGVSAVQFIDGQPAGGDKRLSILTGDGTLITTKLVDNPTLVGNAANGATRVLWRELSN